MTKNYFCFLLISISISIGFANKNANNPFIPTSLKIIVTDVENNPIEDVSVTLFENEKDYRAETNKILTTKKTNAKGQVVFKKLKPKRYYIHATKGKLSNISENVLTNKLLEGKINKVVTVIN